MAVGMLQHAPMAPVPVPARMAPVWSVGALGLVVGAIGAWNPSYWGDEAASVMSATRPWPSLVTELQTVDTVHGIYYAFLHVWTSVFGTSEFATRLPSAIAVGFMVAGTAWLVTRFAGIRLGLLAGVVAAVLPRTTWMAEEARSYAIGTAAAVWLTVLLVHLVRREARTRVWLVYGVGMAAAITLFADLSLMLLVHISGVLILHRRMLRAWGVGAATAIGLSLPLLFVGFRQRGQVSFLAEREYATFTNVVATQWFDSPGPAVLCWALILFAAFALVRGHRAGALPRGWWSLGLLAAAWLAVPTAGLLVVNATIAPMYSPRYLSFTTPAAAILVALGIAAVASRVAAFARPHEQARAGSSTAIAILLVLVCVVAPGYTAQRGQFAKDAGSDLRQVSAYVGQHAQPGDAVVFDEGTEPFRAPRLALGAYPAGFAGLDDLEMLSPYAHADGLWDHVAQLSEVANRLQPGQTVWAIESTQPGDPTDVTELLGLGYRISVAVLVHRTTVYQLTLPDVATR